MDKYKNKPYVKEYDDKGNITNPITKDNPYRHPLIDFKKRRDVGRNPKNNKKGINLLIINYGFGTFVKYHVKKQYIRGSTKRDSKTIYHYVEK